MDSVVAELERAARTGLIPGGSAVLLAVSGGADSMALLHGAAEASAQTAWELSVGHVHHGWRRREADRDVAFVAETARRLGLPFFLRRCDARLASKQLGVSPEAGARHVRYAALGEIARKSGAVRIATAHQQDDVLESHLLAFERRGGLAGLAGPRESREDGVVRPLLSVSRAEILRFLAERGIGFRRDSTNGDLSLPRNRVRRELARLREAPGGEAAVRAFADEVSVLAVERRRLEEEFEALVRPTIHALAEGTIADAALLERCPEELQRLALDRLAGPYARPGRPPMTGREREQVRLRLSSGADFRFEAGRHIRFERRGGTLGVGPRRSAPVYDSSRHTSTAGRPLRETRTAL